MTDTETTGALILSAWNQIAADRRCDLNACRRIRGLERLQKCDCLAVAARRVRELLAPTLRGAA